MKNYFSTTFTIIFFINNKYLLTCFQVNQEVNFRNCIEVVQGNHF